MPEDLIQSELCVFSFDVNYTWNVNSNGFTYGSFHL